jgi:hypothetical protein
MSSQETTPSRDLYFRFHLLHVHLHSVFGDDWFALKAEAFARFFGTPVFLVAQTSQLLELLRQNTELTELVRALSQRIETLTIEMHGKVVQADHRG